MNNGSINKGLKKLLTFQLVDSSELEVTATHTTPIHFYVDDITFKFAPRQDGGCDIDVRSFVIIEVVWTLFY